MDAVTKAQAAYDRQVAAFKAMHADGKTPSFEASDRRRALIGRAFNALENAKAKESQK